MHLMIHNQNENYPQILHSLLFSSAFRMDSKYFREFGFVDGIPLHCYLCYQCSRAPPTEICCDQSTICASLDDDFDQMFAWCSKTSYFSTLRKLLSDLLLLKVTSLTLHFHSNLSSSTSPP